MCRLLFCLTVLAHIRCLTAKALKHNRLSVDKAASAPVDVVTAFYKFEDDFDRDYSSVAELEERFDIFAQNMNSLADFRRESPMATFKITEFSDWTDEEKQKIVLSNSESSADDGDSQKLESEAKLLTPSVLQSNKHSGNKLASTQIPNSIDWREKGAVTAVKNQGRCGACWAFAAVAIVESALAISEGPLVNLSNQEVLDCAKGSCKGGAPIRGLQYAKAHGLMEMGLYENYRAKKGNCSDGDDSVAVRTNGSVALDADEIAMAEWVATRGPISFNLAVAGSFYNYGGGVFAPTNCTSRSYHEAVIVGYGTKDGLPVWIVKNSWGRNWGENGYGYILRGQNVCRIQSSAHGIAGIAYRA